MTSPAKLKTQLRQHFRQLRRALSPAQQAAAAESALQHIEQLPDWPQRRHIAVYLPADGELDTAPIVQLCRLSKRQLYLPRIGAQGLMSFALWAEGLSLSRNRYGIAEPPLSEPSLACDDLDLVFLPLVSWDRRGHRLGMGGGYYDRLLAEAPPSTLLVGLAHSIQEHEGLPSEAWDIPLDYVLTDSELHRCRNRQN